MSLSLQVAGQSDLGCVRTNNEDNFGYDWRYGIYVVCDGMGGEAAGEVASKMGVDAVLDYCRRLANDKNFQPAVAHFDGVSPRANALANAIQIANQQIRSAAAHNPEQRGMGSTITALLVEGSMYSIAHVGDSRIYLLRKGVIQQLTNDHSLVMEHVRRGLITAEQAQHSEIQNIIIRALGSEDSVEPDLSDLVAEPGDKVLLTTDGLTRHVSDSGILEIIESASSCKQACQQLIDTAKQAGGHDNITCLILHFVEKPWLQKLIDSGPGEGIPKWQDSL
ncbi:MAG: Stp1/IreP family PP2C-type Ser/Thr phosphatase [Candidatus Korobacteraceae bacterium]|jgi:protein phosphatase